MEANRKILFVVGPALGHIGRSLVIARALVNQSNVTVHFACICPGNGARTIGSEFEVTNIGYDERGGRTFATNLERVMTLECPDLICLDLTPLPWLYQVIFPPIPQVYITNFFLTRLGKETTLQDLWLKKHHEICNRHRMLRGLKPINDARILYERDLVLLADPLPLMGGLSDLPTNYVAVGPCVWEAKSNKNDEDCLKQSILYISMGSSGSREISLKHIEALANCIDVNKIIWVGKRNVVNEKCSVDCSYEDFNSLSASKVIPQAKLVITQGGAGSTYQSLGYGVPVGIWPTHMNHSVLGKYIQQNGFGALLTGCFEDNIVHVNANLDIYRQNILSVGSDLSFESAPGKASNILLEFLESFH